MIDGRNLVGFSEPHGSDSSRHKLQRFFPLATDDLSVVFGTVDLNGKWTDGILTAAWKKASNVRFISHSSLLLGCVRVTKYIIMNA
jgi:hypothetical protein